jgi:uncharacterized membrane protein
MWFLGAISGLAGLVIGALVNGWPGALGGAILGGIAGIIAHAMWGERATSAVSGSRGAPSTDPRVDHIFRSLRHIHLRLEEIEKRLGIAELPPMPDADRAPESAAQAAATDTSAAPDSPANLPPSFSPRMPEPPAIPETGSLARPAVGPMAAAASEHAAAIATTTPSGGPPPVPPATAPDRPVWWRWVFGGNTLVRLGVVILFFGVAFLVKYATENFRFPIELRLAGIATGAIVMLAIGWRLRGKRAGYALAMQGGGIGVLYLTVFAALRLYALMPPTVAFALLLGVVATSVILAVRQDALSLAMLAVAGGFLAPVLASTGQGSHVMLFGYYVLLNLGVLAIAWHKAWRPLNLLGFVFTFAIGALWGARFYRAEHFATTEPFLIAFFLIYVGIALLYALRRSIAVKSYVDGTLVFGTPLIAFALQSRLVRDTEYGLAFSALALGAFYVLLAVMLWSRRSTGLKLLVESSLALGVAFGTLAIPLALDGRWTSAAWALEGAAIVWAGVRQERRVPQWAGVALQLAAGVAFAVGNESTRALLPIANSVFLGCVFLALAGLFCARQIKRNGAAFFGAGRIVAGALFFWSIAWWVLGGLNEIDRFVPGRFELAAAIAFLAATAGAASLVRAKLDWRIALVPAFALLPAMVVCGMAAVVEVSHPLARFGWLAWPFAFATLAWILRRHEDEVMPALARWSHVVALWLGIALACWEAAWWIDRFVQGRGTWPFVAWALVPALALAALTKFGERMGWPFTKHLDFLLRAGGLPMAAYLWGWVFVANVLSDGNPAPLPYVPVANPLDLAMAAVIVVLIVWYLALRVRGRAARVPPAHAAAAIGAAAFVWANGMLLRTLHHWAGVPYRLETMLRSTLVQTAFSVFWTVLALAAMTLATRRGLRTLWFVGAALLGVVVLKLFVVDLSRVGGIERIVSFIGVGVLLLAIGYFSPVPPRHSESKS